MRRKPFSIEYLVYFRYMKAIIGAILLFVCLLLLNAFFS